MDEDDYEETFVSRYVYEKGLTFWRAVYLPFVAVIGLTAVTVTVYLGIVKLARGTAYLLSLLPDSMINLDVIEAFLKGFFALITPLVFAFPFFVGGYLIRSLANISINNNDSNTKVMLYSFVTSVLIVGYVCWKYVF